MGRPPERNEKLDLRAYLPDVRVDRLFDVGANVGQTVQRFRRRYPEAEIWAFEPIAESFAALQEAVAPLTGVRAFDVALSAREGEDVMLARGTSPKNRMAGEERRARYVPGTEGLQQVRVVTGDAFCAEHGVDRIDYLKVDTEGHDLEVLRGFEGMLREHRIDLVLVEAGMNAANHRHIALEAFKAHLEPLGYFVFRIYNQSGEGRRGPHLRRVDALFVSQRVIDTHLANHPR